MPFGHQVNDRGNILGQNPLNLSLEQSIISETNNNPNESQLVMKLPEGTFGGNGAGSTNEFFSQTMNQKCEPNIQIAQFFERKKSQISPQKHNFL